MGYFRFFLLVNFAQASRRFLSHTLLFCVAYDASFFQVFHFFRVGLFGYLQHSCYYHSVKTTLQCRYLWCYRALFFLGDTLGIDSFPHILCRLSEDRYLLWVSLVFFSWHRVVFYIDFCLDIQKFLQSTLLFCVAYEASFFRACSPCWCGVILGYLQKSCDCHNLKIILQCKGLQFCSGFSFVFSGGILGLFPFLIYCVAYQKVAICWSVQFSIWHRVVFYIYRST